MSCCSAPLPVQHSCEEVLPVIAIAFIRLVQFPDAPDTLSRAVLQARLCRAGTPRHTPVVA